MRGFNSCTKVYLLQYSFFLIIILTVCFNSQKSNKALVHLVDTRLDFSSLIYSFITIVNLSFIISIRPDHFLFLCTYYNELWISIYIYKLYLSIKRYCNKLKKKDIVNLNVEQE